MEKNLRLLSSLKSYIYITKFRRFCQNKTITLPGSTSQRKVVDDGFLACLNIQITRVEKKVVTLTGVIIWLAARDYPLYPA